MSVPSALCARLHGEPEIALCDTRCVGEPSPLARTASGLGDSHLTAGRQADSVRPLLQRLLEERYLFATDGLDLFRDEPSTPPVLYSLQPARRAPIPRWIATAMPPSRLRCSLYLVVLHSGIGQDGMSEHRSRSLIITCCNIEERLAAQYNRLQRSPDRSRGRRLSAPNRCSSRSRAVAAASEQASAAGTSRSRCC